MKVIFLDIDGVLNTERYVIEQYKKTGKPHSTHHSEFDPICMENLKDFIKQTDAYIVISSSWRLGNHKTDKGWKTLINRFNTYGLLDRIIGCTPCLDDQYKDMCCRGHEIQKWLDDNKNIDNFVIIDDDRDMFHLISKLAKCNFKDGFSDKVKQKALEIINKIRV